MAEDWSVNSTLAGCAPPCEDSPIDGTSTIVTLKPPARIFQMAVNGVRLPSPVDWILDRREDSSSDVGVPKASEQVVAIEYGGEQANVAGWPHGPPLDLCILPRSRHDLPGCCLVVGESAMSMGQ